MKKGINTKIIGNSGEDLAADYLRERGYKVLEQNYHTRFGEIDIVARDGECLCFIEVKTRYSLEKGSPFEAITLRKQINLTKAALGYIQEHECEDELCRFDVLGILVTEGECEIELLKDAFESMMR